MHVTGIYSVVNSFVPFSSFVDYFWTQSQHKIDVTFRYTLAAAKGKSHFIRIVNKADINAQPILVHI